MIECPLVSRVIYKLIESEPHVHSLQELTIRLILKVLVGLIKEIDKQDIKVFRRREMIYVNCNMIVIIVYCIKH